MVIRLLTLKRNLPISLPFFLFKRRKGQIPYIIPLILPKATMRSIGTGRNCVKRLLMFRIPCTKIFPNFCANASWKTTLFVNGIYCCWLRSRHSALSCRRLPGCTITDCLLRISIPFAWLLPEAAKARRNGEKSFSMPLMRKFLKERGASRTL